MAGFLFRKQKQDLISNRGQIVVSSPTALQPSVSTPLYSRFTSLKDDYSGAGPVSAASALSSPKSHSRSYQGERTGNVVAGKYGYSSKSLASSIRDVEEKSLKELEQQTTGQLQERPVNRGRSFPRVLSQSIVDKPLPPPVPPAEDKPPSVRSATSNRGAPPSSFSMQQMRGRLSPDLQARENKPLPRPGSSQAIYSENALPAFPSSITKSVPPTSPPPPASANSVGLDSKVQQRQSQSSTLFQSPESETDTLLSSLSTVLSQRNGSQNMLPTASPSSSSTDTIAMPATPSYQNASQGTPSSEATLDLPEIPAFQVSLVMYTEAPILCRHP